MFFSGSLQEGIALAVQESKAVICFVQDDGQTSSTWQEEYFAGDEEFTRLLEARSVLLRITKESPEAGFLASVCPVSQYPTVVAIKNGMLREYIVPDVQIDEFRIRLTAVMEDRNLQTQVAGQSTDQPSYSQNQGADASPPRPPQAANQTATSATTIPPTAQTSSSQEQPSHGTARGREDEKNTADKGPAESSRRTAVHPPRKQPEHRAIQFANKPKESLKNVTKRETPASRAPGAEKPAQQSPSKPAPTPQEYRLQVRLFDGRSVRSTFSPSHTIRKDVRPWLDSQMEERKPYNLKHILTPLPNQTLTIAEEDQTLREIITGSTATFVMVPIKSYIEAYSESGSLPVRAVSSVYGIVSSVVGTATGYFGSLLGYGQNQAAQPRPEPAHTSGSQSTGETPRRRPFGPNIRTLRDQMEGQDRSEFYNGNQLNFEPRGDDER
ncbi:hypothetical protein ASPCAL10943 [Aspergillus calidoustus]|uniref:UBX domain-containing protein 2 n=1 Tax=Aspergillus calidoustus TaxID=454130 RepID=A0A0U5GA20_ASPCI|nr:hypothetical protein ASPCAL10943 [Aspergillus calidoustus]